MFITYLQWDLIPPLPPPLTIYMTTDPSIVLAEILIVAAGLVCVFKRQSTTNIAHPPIPQELASGGGGDIGGRGRCGGFRHGCHFCCCHTTYLG